jgi:hypothetical protein
MIRVYGFEGAWPRDASVAWGAAALLVRDDIVCNAYSRLTISLQELTATDAIDVVSTLPDDVEIDDRCAESDVTVVALRRTDHFYLFKARLGSQAGLIQRRSVAGHTFYYVFATRETFHQYASKVSARVFADFLKNESRPNDIKQRILYDAITLDPHSPYLHVLRTLAAPNRDATKRLVAASLRSDPDRETYRRLLEACTSDHLEYSIKYSGGIAKGRGLEVGKAKEQFAAIKTIDDRLIPYLRKTIPFLRVQGTQAPSLRVVLLPGSAEIVFSATVEDEPLFRRVARYIELTYLQDALSGNLPEDLSRDTTFTDALETVVNPSPDTQLQHRPIGRTEYEDVVVPRIIATKVREHGPLTILGTPQGASGEMKRIDIKLFPGIRESVSLEDNGFGGPPLGREFFHERNDFLFRPFVFKMWRQIDEDGRHVFWLQSAKLVDIGSTEPINAIPSSVVPGGFFMSLDLTVSVRSSAILSIRTDAVGQVGNPSLVTWESFLSRYASWCENYELEMGERDDAVWIPPTKQRSVSRLIRTLRALDELGGAAPFERIRELDGRADPRRDRIARWTLHNLFQEHPDLLLREERDDDYEMIMTARGRQFLAVYRRAQHFLAEVPESHDASL